MRILIATTHRSIQGGIEKYVQTLIPALLDQNQQVALLYEHGACDGAETVDPSGAGLSVWCAKDLLAEPSRWEELARWKPDVVYSQGLESTEAEAALLERFPTVMYAHVYWGTCINGGKCHSFPRREPCHRRFGPACLGLYYPRRCGGLNPLLAWDLYQTNRARNELLNRYRSMLVASTSMYREYEQHGVGAEKLQLVPLPVADFEAGRQPDLNHRLSGMILFVGRLTELKGVDYLIRAIPRAALALGRALTLTIVGDGPMRSELEDLARRLSVDVQFTGWLEGERKQRLLCEADLLAVPSLWPEPFGLVGVEAGRTGLPAVGFASGGIPDWLIPGQSGEIAPAEPPTVEGLAEAIVRALENPERYSRLRRGAFEVSRRFTLKEHLARLLPVLSAAYRSLPQPAMAGSTT